MSAAAMKFTMYSAWAMSLLYAAALAAMIAGRSWNGRTARVLWTLACFALWVHVALAFHFAHQWSHAHALDHTANQTAVMVGVRSGAGIYLNYFVMIVWTADVAYWWAIGAERHRWRSRTVMVVMHAFLLFMMFNATVVFGHSSTRYTGIVVIACLAMLAATRLLRKRG